MDPIARPSQVSSGPATMPIAGFIAVMIAGLLVHAWLFPFIMQDVGNDYVPWFLHIVAAGPVRAFTAPFGSYTPPYLYLLALATPLHGVVADAYVIKIVSVIGSLALAGAVWRLLRTLGVPGVRRWALAATMLPSVTLNAALLGQCDALYAAPLVMATAAALRREHRAMLAWAGLALAIKAQAVLIAPFILALLLARRVPLAQWLWAPAAFLAALAPAWLVGWPAADLLTIYFRQADTFHDIARNVPNVWLLLDAAGLASNRLTGAALALAVTATAAYVWRLTRQARALAPEMLLRAALLAPLLMAGLLPKMHERYFFLADVLVLALAAACRTRETVTIAVLVQLGSAGAVIAYASGVAAPALFGAVAMIVATVRTARPFLARRTDERTEPAYG